MLSKFIEPLDTLLIEIEREKERGELIMLNGKELNWERY